MLFSVWGDGAAIRAGTDVALLWIAFVGFRLVQKAERRSADVSTEASTDQSAR